MKIKKIFSLTIACVLLLSAIGCTGGSPASTSSVPASSTTPSSTPVSSSASESSSAPVEPIMLRMWGGVQGEYGYDKMVENFNEEFADRGISIEYTRYVNDTNGNLQLETYLMAGGEIDIFMGYGGKNRLMPRVESGMLLDMTDLLNEYGFDPIPELGKENVEGFLVDGKAYALPTKYENSAYWYANVDMFNAAGVDIPYDGWTFDQFREAAKKLTHGEGQDKVYGMFWWAIQDSAMYRIVITSMLGDKAIYKDDSNSETNYDHQIWNQGLQLIVDTMNTDKTAPSIADEASDSLTFANMFLEGKTAMTVGIAQMRLIKDLATYPHDFTTAIIPAPVPSEEYLDRADHRHLLGAGDLICVSGKTSYPKEAVEAVIWYIKGGMAPLATGGRIPLWSGVSSNDVVAAMMDGADGVFDIRSIEKYLSIDNKGATSKDPGPAQSEIITMIAEECASAMYGQKTVTQALADAKGRGDALIAAAAK